ALVSSHDLFPAYRVGNAVRLAERHHLPDAGNRYPRFHRSGLVVKAAVQHAAVVSGLMLGDSVLFFEHRDARPREPLAQPVGSGQANDAAANDDNFWGVHKNTIASVVCRGRQSFSQLIANILTQLSRASKCHASLTYFGAHHNVRSIPKSWMILRLVGK